MNLSEKLEIENAANSSPGEIRNKCTQYNGAIELWKAARWVLIGFLYACVQFDSQNKAIQK